MTPVWAAPMGALRAARTPANRAPRARQERRAAPTRAEPVAGPAAERPARSTAAVPGPKWGAAARRAVTATAVAAKVPAWAETGPVVRKPGRAEPAQQVPQARTRVPPGRCGALGAPSTAECARAVVPARHAAHASPSNRSKNARRGRIAIRSSRIRERAAVQGSGAARILRAARTTIARIARVRT